MGKSDTWQNYKLPHLETLQPSQQYSELENIVDKADEVGVFPVLPGSARDVRYTELNESRTRTVRTRLYLLGYLGKDNESGLLDAKLQDAIRQFQQEAHLTTCGWVDEATWTALQEIVGFEHPGNLEKWMKDSDSRSPHPILIPALMRAVKLRLFVLGLLKHKQPKKQEKVTEALEKFKLIAQILKLSDDPGFGGYPVYSLPVIATLFDQDNIADCLAKAGESFTIHRPEHISRAKAGKTIKEFIICCAKIELWLLGYDVALNGKSRFSIPTEGKRYAPVKYPFYNTLVQFWSDNGSTRQIARKQATGITGHFFRTLQEAQREDNHEPETGGSDELYNQVIREPAETQDKIVGFIKTIGSRIWDGLKRVWRWFKRLIRGVVKKVTHWLKTLARLAFRYAMNVFPTVKQMVKALSVSVSFLTHRTVPGSNVEHLVINRSKDFDYCVYINPDCDWEVGHEILNRFRLNARVFKVGAQIGGRLINILISVIKNVARGGGWFGFILALVKIYSKLKKLKMVLDENQAVLASI